MSAATTSVGLVRDTLDDLEVTDTVFHDLAFTLPLAAILIDKISTRPPNDRVLLIGPNVALAKVLVAQGRDVSIWHVPGVALTEDLRDRVTRKGTLDALLEPGDDGVDGAASFDVIVAPYVLDATTAEPAVALGTLHGLVAPTGVILVAVRRAGSLASRFDAVRGRSALPDAAVAAARHSWSWPMATPRRLVDPKSLRASARRAGLRMVECEDVIDTTGVVEVNALPVGQWVSARLAHSAKALFPTLRDTMVSTLVPLTVGRADAALGSDITKLPTVTVVVDSRDAARTARLIGDLDGQTYPRELIEVIVACPPDAGFLPADAETEAPRIRRQRVDTFDAEAANALVRRARGSVVAFTDDACRLPAGWVESGLRAMGQYTTALSGGVLADTTSAAPFLALPGRRRKNSGSGLFLAANSFYVREALLQVGGFDENAHADWGWDSTASARLAAAGFPVSQDATAFVFRHFAFAPNRAWIREEFEFAAAIPSGVRRMPGLRSTALHHGVFASERTLAFDVLVAGLAVAAIRRNPWYAVAGSIPWLRTVGEFVDFWPPAEWRTSLRHVRGAGVRSAVWAAGLAVGSVRARRVVL